MGLPTYVQQGLARLRQGPVEVRFDPDGTPVNVICNDGVDLSVGRGQEEAVVDVIGVYDLYTSGDSVTFSLNLPEWSHNALSLMFMDCEVGTAYVGIGQTAGTSLRASAQKVEIRPYQGRAADTTLLTLWVVVPSGDGGLGMSSGEPWNLTQEFRALPDASKQDGQMIGQLAMPVRS